MIESVIYRGRTIGAILQDDRGFYFQGTHEPSALPRERFPTLAECRAALTSPPPRSIDAVLTTMESGKLVETVIDHPAIGPRIDFATVLRRIARQKFGTNFQIKRDSTVIGGYACAPNGDTIHLR